MKRIPVVFVLVVVGMCFVYADITLAQEEPSEKGLAQASLCGNGDFAASAVLWFRGTEVTSDIFGSICLYADLAIGDVVSKLNPAGTLSGKAIGNTDTLIGSGWAIFTSRGSLDSGEDVVLYGAIEISPDGIDFSSQSAPVGKGTLYILLSLQDETLCLRGAASGTASGGFVNPDNPHTMQLEEIGAFAFMVTTDHETSARLIADLCLTSSGLSWSLDEWPREIREGFEQMIKEEW